MKLASIVLAAGRSSRFGAEKLLAPLGGVRVIDHAVAAAREAPVAMVVLVQPLRLDLGIDGVETICVDGDGAMSASLAAGIDALPADCDGAFVFLADMPFIPKGLAARQANRLRGEIDAIVPIWNGRRGHPVLFHARTFGRLARLEGDRGARDLIATGLTILEEPSEDGGICFDIDSPADLERAQARARARARSGGLGAVSE